MAKPLIVVTGASGHVGSEISRRLLDGGHRVRVIARTADKLKPHGSRGAEVNTGSLEDPAFTRRALEGAAAVFAMIPPNFQVSGFRAYQNRISDALASAVEANRVGHVVTLSSIGAHLKEGAGPVNGLHDMEERFHHLKGVNVLHLRPGYFMENLLTGIGLIKSQAIHGTALRADLPMTLIATRDIAEVGAKYLGSLDFKGNEVLELMGPKDVTMTEVTQAIGAAIGKPDLKYVQFPYEDATKTMVGMGLPAELVDLYMEMTRGFNEGKIKPTQARTPKTSTPTTIQSFAQTIIAPAYKAIG